LALSVPLSRFASQVGGGSAFYVRRHCMEYPLFFIFWAAIISLGLNKRRPLIAKFIIAIGCVSLMATVITYFYTRHFISHAQRTSGTVVEIREKTDAENSICDYAIIFRFQDASGLPHTVSSTIFASVHAGDSITVLYPSDDPQNARINRFWQVWRLPIIFGICGSIELLFGLIVLYWRMIKAQFRRQTQNAPVA
jgi:hypothetical protein